MMLLLKHVNGWALFSSRTFSASRVYLQHITSKWTSYYLSWPVSSASQFVQGATFCRVVEFPIMETVWRHSEAQIGNFALKFAINDICVLCLCSGAKMFHQIHI